MKFFITILFIIVEANLSFSQHLTCSDSTLIRKNKVKTASSWFFNETVKNDLNEVWTYDNIGQKTSYELIDTKDTTKDIEIYFYKNNLLVEDWHIGTWQKYDTIRTAYLYNNRNQLLNKTVKGGWCSYSFDCAYTDDLLTNRIYKEVGNCKYGNDTLIYDKQKRLLKTLNPTKDVRYSYTYNSDGQLSGEKKSAISDTNKIYQFSDYYYLKDKLVKEDVGNSKSGNQAKLRKCVYRYYYYDNGLLKEIRRLDNEKISYYTKFSYTFY